MPMKNIQEFRSDGANWKVCFYSLLMSASKVAGTTGWTRGLQTERSFSMMHYFQQSSEALHLSQVSKMLLQLSGQISAHCSSSEIRNTHLCLFRPDRDHDEKSGRKPSVIDDNDRAAFALIMPWNPALKTRSDWWQQLRRNHSHRATNNTAIVPQNLTKNATQFWPRSLINFYKGCPWKSNVVLEKSLKNGCNFLYEPCIPIGGWVNLLGEGWVGLVKMRESPGFRSPEVGICVDSTGCLTSPILSWFSGFFLKTWIQTNMRSG